MQRMFAINEESLRQINEFLRKGWEIKGASKTLIPGTFVTLELDRKELESLRQSCQDCVSDHHNCNDCQIGIRCREIQECTERSGTQGA